MKSFLWNRIAVKVYANNKELYNSLADSLHEFIGSSSFTLLKDKAFILTRESITAQYLSMNLTKDGIPSLGFSVEPLRKGILNFLNSEVNFEDAISDRASILLIEQVLIQEKGNFPSRISSLSLASEIFKYWKTSFISGKDFRKGKYSSIISKFLSLKNGKKNLLEMLALAIEESNFKSNKELKEEFSGPIIIYGVTEPDELILKLLKAISKVIEVEFRISRPITKPIIDELANVNNLFPGSHILKKVFSNLDENFIHGEASLENKPSLVFFKAPEVYREIEYIGRSILKIAIENSGNKEFKLTKIKLILPDEPAYIFHAGSIFENFKIPFSYTKDSSSKLSPFYSAFLSLIELACSKFDSESVFNLVNNPCFNPGIEDFSGNIQPEYWKKIISEFNLSGFLDGKHRDEFGIQKTELLTWSNLWNRIIKGILGEEEGIFWEKDEKEEAMKFVKITSSLLNDLIALNEDEWDIPSYAKYFRIIIETYLSANSRLDNVEDNLRRNERVQKKIFSALKVFESLGDEIYLTQKIQFEDFATMLKDELESHSDGSPGVLKNGVVIGTLADTTDPVFDYIFVAGLDENKFPLKFSGKESLFTEEELITNKQDQYLHSKYNFYGILNHCPKRITFSYICLDTIKDRPFYPSCDIENFYKYVYPEVSEPIKWEQISLFSYEDGNSNEQDIYINLDMQKLKNLKKKEESLPELKTIIPNWQPNQNSNISSMIKELNVEESISNSIQKLFIRPLSSASISKSQEIKSISLSKLIRYLECPRKFLYNEILNLEEESEVTGETYSIDRMLSFQSSKNLLISSLMENGHINSNSLLEKIFNFESFSRGKIPLGVMGKLTREQWQVYLESQILPFANAIKTEFSVMTDCKFADLNESNLINENTFPSFIHNGISLEFKADLILRKGDSIYIVNTSSTSQKSILNKKIYSILSTNLILSSDLILNKIKEKNFIKSPRIYPCFIVLEYGKSPEFVKGAEEDLFNFQSMLDELISNYKSNCFPASPLRKKDDEDSNSCDYCPIKMLCPGYKMGFENWLNYYMTKLIDLSENIFKKQSEK